MSANLRRSLNKDLVDASFRTNLSRYLGSFSNLIDESWNSFRDLQAYTTGLHLDVMFADRSYEQASILLAEKQSKTNDGDLDSNTNKLHLEQLAHIMTVAKKGNFYAMPLLKIHQSSSSSTDFVCFQLLGFRPGHRKYIQRLTHWATDIWHGALMCSSLWTFSVPNTNGTGFALVPGDLTISFESSNVQPWSVGSFFEDDRVEHLYMFNKAEHEVGFDAASIQDYTEELEEQLDLALVKLNYV